MARRVGARAPQDEGLFEVEKQGPPPAPDPSLVLAELLLRRALTEAGLTVANLQRPGCISIMTVPADDWLDILVTAWGRLAQDGRAPTDGDASSIYYKPTWVVFRRRSDGASQAIQARTRERIADAVWQDIPILGAAVTTENALPSDLLAAADIKVVVPAPTPKDVADAVAVLYGAPAGSQLADDEACRLTPRVLRLARRPQMTAAEYVDKVRDILARELLRASAPVAAPKSPREQPDLMRLHGMDEARAWGLALAKSIRAYVRGEMPWADVDGGCLLSGPPGCGKTTFARALAATCGVPLVTGSYAAWLGTGRGHQGDLLRSMRQSFENARQQAPALLFIDEVDSFPNRATIRHDYASWETQVVNGLLAEIDGVQGREGVVVIAACNHPHMLDPALTRSGRLDRHIRIGLPDPGALEKIMGEHLAGDLLGEDLQGLALLAVGSSGADIERVVRDARRRAREAGRAMEKADLEAAIAPAGCLSKAERHRAAVHEAGHAVAACVLFPGTLQSVSIRPTARAAGATITTPLFGVTPTRDDLLRHMAFLLAGRAAEEVLLGSPSAGAGGGPDSDLAQATQVAMTIVASLGLDDEAGLLWWTSPETCEPLRLFATLPKTAKRAGDLVANSHRDAVDLVQRNAGAVRRVATLLCEVGAVSAAAVQRVLAGNTAAR